MSELRECPFCGGELTCVSGTGVDLMTQDNRPYIGCKVCEWTLSGRRLTEIAKVINCRPTEDALRAENARLQKRVGEVEERLYKNSYIMECEADKLERLSRWDIHNRKSVINILRANVRLNERVLTTPDQGQGQEQEATYGPIKLCPHCQRAMTPNTICGHCGWSAEQEAQR